MDAAWSAEAIGGVYRFLNRCWTLTFDKERIKEDKNLAYRHKTIKKVTEDMHRNNFNTAVAALMEFVNELYKNGANKEDLIILAKLLKPFAPHLASEMLEELKSDDIWPKWDEKHLVADEIEMVVQVNGKLRARIMMPRMPKIKKSSKNTPRPMKKSKLSRTAKKLLRQSLFQRHIL